MLGGVPASRLFGIRRGGRSNPMLLVAAATETNTDADVDALVDGA